MIVVIPMRPFATAAWSAVSPQASACVTEVFSSSTSLRTSFRSPASAASLRASVMCGGWALGDLCAQECTVLVLTSAYVLAYRNRQILFYIIYLGHNTSFLLYIWAIIFFSLYILYRYCKIQNYITLRRVPVVLLLPILEGKPWRRGRERSKEKEGKSTWA